MPKKTEDAEYDLHYRICTIVHNCWEKLRTTVTVHNTRYLPLEARFWDKLAWSLLKVRLHSQGSEFSVTYFLRVSGGGTRSRFSHRPRLGWVLREKKSSIIWVPFPGPAEGNKRDALHYRRLRRNLRLGRIVKDHKSWLYYYVCIYCWIFYPKIFSPSYELVVPLDIGVPI